MTPRPPTPTLFPYTTLFRSNKEFSISLAPETLRRTEVVDVKGDIFHGDNPAVPSQLTLTPQELKESATVLANDPFRSEEHTSELQSRRDLVCRLLLEKKKA